jgi:hypothetical protein
MQEKLDRLKDGNILQRISYAPKGYRVEQFFPVARFISEYIASPVRRWLPDGATKMSPLGLSLFHFIGLTEE